MREIGNTIYRAAGPAVAAMLLAAGCAGSAQPTAVPREAAGPEAVSDPVSAVPDRLEIAGMEVERLGVGARLRVDTDGALVWTSYREDSRNLVIELPNSTPAAAVADLWPEAGVVESVVVSSGAGDRPLTRLLVTTREETEYSITAEQGDLWVDLVPPGAAVAAAPSSLPAEPARAEAETDVAEKQPAEPAEVAAEAGTLPEEAPGSAPGPENPRTGAPAEDQVAASYLENVEVLNLDGETVVRILGDGAFYYSTFHLAEPDRYVLDLIGVANLAPLGTYPVDGELIERVRVAQFKPHPELVARVVVDLTAPVRPELVELPDGLSLSFSENDVPPTVSDTTLFEDVVAADPGEPLQAAGSDEAEAPVPSPKPLSLEPSQDSQESLGDSSELPAEQADGAEEGRGEPVASEAAPEVIPELLPAEEVDEPYQVALVPEQGEPVEGAEPEVAPPPVAEAPSTPESAAPAALTKATEPIYIASSGADEPAGPPGEFDSRNLAAEGKTYRGEPMTITLKDADVRDLLRSFAQISGLNIIVQPGVSGTVTAELVDVPWDQALEQVLKVNDLGYELDGNIMRVASLRKLREEAEEEQRLRQVQAEAVPLTTIIKRISYATAGDIAQVLQSGSNSVLSRRGSVVVDGRTNTLIITELPNFIDTVVAVIETLDIPEPQVMIEARIIETTKRFSRNLGINWGLSAISDAAHGNTTGLVFPNNATVDGTVDLSQPGNASLGISLGNVLDTLRLDVALQAAENEGLINILSAPKITTLNNEQATIQSGLQIPIQTVANNTVSVQFVSATLRLQVTPHVTAEGTVLMDIDIQKREPLLAFAIQGATNAPIATKDAKTRVIVRDGGTTVIGGIYEVTSDEGEDRVPGLSKVPLLKHLFKNNRQSEENEELLIFITPRVVKL